MSKIKPQYIDIVEVTVSTIVGTAAKVGTTSSGAYTPKSGDMLRVTFSNGNTANTPTLNIDGSGTKNIMLGNSQVTVSGLKVGTGAKVMLFYDGTSYQLYGSQNNTNIESTVFTEDVSGEYTTPTLLVSATDVSVADAGSYYAGANAEAVLQEVGSSLGTLSGTLSTLSSSVAGKENALPTTPSSPESKYLNGNKQWTGVVSGSGGYAANVYMTNTTSTIVGTYKQSGPTNAATQTEVSAVANNNEVLMATYLFESALGITTIDPGVWLTCMHMKVSAGTGRVKFEVFKRATGGTETTLFSAYSADITNTSYQIARFETIQSAFTTDATDRLGHRIYACNSTTGDITVSYLVGEGDAAYINTPLALRHSQLRGKNDESTYLHITSTEKTGYDTASTNTHTHSNKSGLDLITDLTYIRQNPQYFHDYHAAGVATANFSSVAISSGTMAYVNTLSAHPGYMTVTSSATANSGAYSYLFNVTSLHHIEGGEVYECIFQPKVTSNTNTTIRFGLLDSTTYADAVDGCYFELPAGSLNLVGKTSSNSSRSTTSTVATLTVGTWYRARVTVNSTSSVTFEVFNDAGTSLGSQSLTANIPTASGRECGAGFIATNSGTTATLLVWLDYQAVKFIEAR